MFTQGDSDAGQDCVKLFRWIQGIAEQASSHYENAHGVYVEFLSLATTLNAQDSVGNSDAAAQRATLFLACRLQPFVLERIGECYCQIFDWRGFKQYKDNIRSGSMLGADKSSSDLNRFLMHRELMATCDGDGLAEAAARLCMWEADAAEQPSRCSGPQQVGCLITL